MGGGVALIGALLVATQAQVPYDAPKALADKLKSLAGAEALDCGTVVLGDDSANAVECAEAALAAGKAYRLAIEFEGPDGAAAWQGAARDPGGTLWTVFFDSDPGAKPGTGDTVTVVPCSEIRFADKGDDVIRCQPILGR